MPRQKTITLYTFEELSPEAQQRAIERYRAEEQQSSDTDWAEYVLEDAEKMAGLLGIELRYHDVPLMNGTTRRKANIWWSLGYCQNDFACVEGRYSYAKACSHHIRQEAPDDTVLHRIADMLRDAQRPYLYQLTATITQHHHYGCQVEVEAPPHVRPEDLTAVKEAIRTFNTWIYQQLDKEWTYQQSDECIRERLENTDEEYDEHGSLET